MPDQRMPKVPKVREYFQIKMTDGSIITGFVFVDATSRIQDVLNNEVPFIPFIDEHDVIQLINKASIAQVRPFDA